MLRTPPQERKQILHESGVRRRLSAVRSRPPRRAQRRVHAWRGGCRGRRRMLSQGPSGRVPLRRDDAEGAGAFQRVAPVTSPNPTLNRAPGLREDRAFADGGIVRRGPPRCLPWLMTPTGLVLRRSRLRPDHQVSPASNSLCAAWREEADRSDQPVSPPRPQRRHSGPRAPQFGAARRLAEIRWLVGDFERQFKASGEPCCRSTDEPDRRTPQNTRFSPARNARARRYA
jgi:hypothetical protein